MNKVILDLGLVKFLTAGSILFIAGMAVEAKRQSFGLVLMVIGLGLFYACLFLIGQTVDPWFGGPLRYFQF